MPVSVSLSVFSYAWAGLCTPDDDHRKFRCPSDPTNAFVHFGACTRSSKNGLLCVCMCVRACVRTCGRAHSVAILSLRHRRLKSQVQITHADSRAGDQLCGGRS